MSAEQKKPGVAFWTIVVLLAVLVLYPLSIGPVFWILVWAGAPQSVLTAVGYYYLPLGIVIGQLETIKNTYVWYIEFGLP